ncbi:MAG TPA: S8 family serine peptidase [bacterium]|nr:S8 family serine peptidase [bacterium]
MKEVRIHHQSSNPIYFAMLAFVLGIVGIHWPLPGWVDPGGWPQSASNSLQWELDMPPIDTLDVSGGMDPGVNPLETVRIFINFKHHPGVPEQALVRMAGGQIRHAYQYLSSLSADVPLAAIGHLKTLASVESIEYVPEVTAVDAELDNAWGVKRTGAGVVHASNKGTGIRVAVIDTGIDYTHPDLAANVKGGWDFVNKDDNPMDDHGHGTHVSGTIAARDDNSGVVGMAPEASLYGLKVLSASGSGYADDVARALEWCITNNIQVVNMSLSGGYSSVLESACSKASQAGIILVAAAGNSGTSSGTGDTVGYPAKYATVIATAATDRSDLRAAFSSTGPAVEIAAPGVSVYSTYPGGRYVSMSGTSMACPHVAGAAALILGAGIPAANVRSLLQSTADDLGTAGRDEWYGYGLLDADEAAQTSEPITNYPPVVTITAPPDGTQVSEGSSITFKGTATDPEDGNLSYSLAWNSSLDGFLGIGNTIIKILKVGTHTISAQVSDSGGKIGNYTITVTVNKVLNNPPSVTITSPANQAVFETGTPITFSGTAVDKEDGDISYKLAWKSSLQGSIGTGTKFSTTLKEGTHTITASVTDSGTLSTSQSVTVTVKNVLDTPPVVSILSPPDGAELDAGSSVTLSGNAMDEKDGDISSKLTWTSSLQGGLGSGKTISAVLIEGTHTITARVTDTGGNTVTQSITVTVKPAPDTPPMVSILSPSDGAELDAGSSVTLSGNAMDEKDGDISSKLTWTSSLQGGLGSGKTISAVLIEGTHTITARVTDTGGNTAAQTITVVIRPVPSIQDNPPVVTILNPSEVTQIEESQSIHFMGTAIDAEDGDISTNLIWSSSIDGFLFIGQSSTKTLSVGTHTITAEVTDSGGNTVHQSRQVTVIAKPLLLEMSVTTNKAEYVDRETVQITHTVKAGGAPVAGAAVKSTLTTALGKLVTRSGNTNTNGVYVYTYRLSTKKDGTGPFKVEATCSKSGYVSGSGSVTFEVK